MARFWFEKASMGHSEGQIEARYNLMLMDEEEGLSNFWTKNSPSDQPPKVLKNRIPGTHGSGRSSYIRNEA